MKRLREPLPNFNETFTHSCNTLASYEVKRNPDPHKKITTPGSLLNKTGSTVSSMIKSKAVYERNKDHATTINDLKTFAKPNLDDGNRFFQDNLELREKYGSGAFAITKSDQTGFRPYKTMKSEGVVEVTKYLTQNTRGYRF